MFRKFHLLLILVFSNSYSQTATLSENTIISILTCGRGEELYSTFGHTAIRIKDDQNQLDVVFNYGAFDFRTENFYFKFIKGNLQYFMNVTSFDEFILEYQIDEREVIEQTLNLAVNQKQKLFDSLRNALDSSERHYTYKFIDRNCTTMVTDKINSILDDKVLTKIDDKTISYRELLYPYFDNYFWYKLGINIIFGAKTDAKADKLFLPIELMHSLDEAVSNGKPLVQQKKTIIGGTVKKSQFEFFNSIYLIIFLLLLIIAFNSRFLFLTYLILCGILGLFLCSVGLFSEHKEVLWNYNALLFNPLFFILPFCRKEFLKKIVSFLIIAMTLYCIFIMNKSHVFIMLPFVMTTLYILVKMRVKS